MKKRYKKSIRSQNKNSRVTTKWQGVRARTTITARRDPGTLQAELGTSSNNSTTFSIAKSGILVDLSGHEARTLYRLLGKHYDDGFFG